MARPKGYALVPESLEDYMECKGKSLTMIAEEAGIRRATLSGLYGQHHAASLPVAHKLANACGLRPGTLFRGLSRIDHEVPA